MDMDALMEQARELQEKVAAAQEELGQTHVKGISNAGACIAEMTCKYDIVGITLREDVLSGGAAYVAQIVTDALRDAKEKADQVIDRVMGAATADMPMPN